MWLREVGSMPDVLISRATVPCLLQGQANKWIKNMEGRGGRLKVLNLQMADMARQVENAIQFGQPVLLQDILQEVDPILEPVLAKAFIKRGNQTLIKLGDKEVRVLQRRGLGTCDRGPSVGV